MVNNPGKKWEQNFKENALKQDLFIIRFNDSDLSFNENKDLRSKAMYKKDKSVKRRNSYENPKIKKLYKELGIKPNSEESKRLLHVSNRKIEKVK